MEHATLSGEVWMDERGEAIVVLPDHLHGREPEYEYRLHCAESTAASAALADGRLAITSFAPHLKVAWRITRRGAADPHPGSADGAPDDEAH